MEIKHDKDVKKGKDMNADVAVTLHGLSHLLFH